MRICDQFRVLWPPHEAGTPMEGFDICVRADGKAMNDLVRKGGFPIAVRTDNLNPWYRRPESTSEFRDDKREIALDGTYR
jgi:hypothetical protein